MHTPSLESWVVRLRRKSSLPQQATIEQNLKAYFAVAPILTLIPPTAYPS
jgi:hypothetical protein